MKRTYKFKNGTIHVVLQKSYDRDYFKKVTEEFLRKVISEGTKNGNSNTSENFTKK